MVRIEETTSKVNKRHTAFRWILGLIIAAIVIGEPLLIWPVFKKLSGKGINWRAWRASYRELNLPVPPSGEPRDGIWGSRLEPLRNPVLGPILPERHLPGMLEIDQYGRQSAVSHAAPRAHLLIIGGSVAAGAYASNLNRTYFSQLAWRLEDLGWPVRITVQAAGSWVSINELKALELYGESIRPDVVIFLDGLNDITQFPERRDRLGGYLKRLRQARDWCLARGMKVVFAPQPFLPQKKRKTTLEMIIQAESTRGKLDPLIKDYTALRAGLQALAIPGKAYYMDCSGAFDQVPVTTFSDIWHFADPGHALLARHMAKKLAPILRQASPAQSN